MRRSTLALLNLNGTPSFTSMERLARETNMKKTACDLALIYVTTVKLPGFSLVTSYVLSARGKLFTLLHLD